MPSAGGECSRTRLRAATARARRGPGDAPSSRLGDNRGVPIVARGPTVAASVVAYYLLWVEPLRFGLIASAALDRLVQYGWPALALLAVRASLVALAMAGARAFIARGDAVLISWFLPLNLLAVYATLATPYFPSNRVPGARPREAVVVLVLHVAAFVVVRWRRELDA